MARALPPLVIRQARVPAPPERRAYGKGDLAARLSPLTATGTRRGDILLVRAVQLVEPARSADLSDVLAARLSGLRQRAARPVNGRVNDGAEAVLFADIAELLAAWAVSGGVSAWWHRAASRLLSGGERGLATTIAARSEVFPTVIRYLDHWQETRKAAARFAPSEIAMLADALAMTWQIDVRTENVSVTAIDDEAVTAPPRSKRGPYSDPTPAEALLAAARLLASPATARAATRGSALTLLLRRALGKRDLTGALQKMDDALHRDPQGAVARFRAGPVVVQAHASAVPRLRVADPDGSTGFASSPAAVPRPPPSGQAAAPRPDDARALPDAEGTLAGLTPASERHTGILDQISEPARSKAREAAPDPQLPEARERRDTLPPDSANRHIETDFGGVFFLWHLVRSLNLPEAAEDWGMPTSLGAWGLIEGLGRALVQPREAECGDPLWTLLADLDGREPGDSAGEEMAVPRIIRIPVAWLDPPPRSLFWEQGKERLLLHDESGLPLMRCPCTPGGLAVALRDARAAYSGATATQASCPLAEPSSATGPFSAPFATWLGWMMPPIRARLADALGCPPEQAAMVLRRRATIQTGPARIEVVFALDRADLPTRRAGLDLDPGWVPALAHVVRFHYV